MVVHILESLKTDFTGIYFNIIPFKSESGKGNHALNLKIGNMDSIKVSAGGKASRVGNYMPGIFYPLYILLNAYTSFILGS